MKIEVLDANDNAPRFPLDSLNVSVPEDLRAGAEIARLRAQDPDSVSLILFV